MKIQTWKHFFDFVLAFFGIIILLPFLLILYVASSVDTSSNGLFIQERIGRFGKPFQLYKFKSIHTNSREISSYGKWIRKYKLDELPQLFNILKGEMSFVGPRPDIPGYYDVLQGDDREVLQLKPGLTSEASIKYRDEEQLLKLQDDPDFYNDTILFPDKVKLNREYLQKISFKNDLRIIFKTITTIFD